MNWVSNLNPFSLSPYLNSKKGELKFEMKKSDEIVNFVIVKENGPIRFSHVEELDDVVDHATTWARLFVVPRKLGRDAVTLK